MYSRGGYLTSCSSDDGGDNKVTFTSQTETVSNNAETLGAITATLAVSDESVATAGWSDDNKTSITITSLKAGTTEVTATLEDESDYATISVTVASDGKITANVTKKVGEEAKEEEEETVDTTVTFLKGITGGSATAASGEGFFAGTKSGDLDVTVSAVELQLYKSGTGWTAIDAASSSTKAGKAGDMMEGPAYISGQFTTKEDAVGNADATVLGTNGYEMGRIKLTVTAGTKAVNVKSLSGYFASGKAFTVGYVKVGDNDYEKIEYEDSAKLTKSSGSQTGFVAKNFAVGKTIAAGTSADVYILLGKVAESGPSAGVTIEVAELVLTMAESASLESIAATTSKAEYAINEDFDTSKVTVKASYSNGKTATVTGWTSNADTVFDKTTAGSYTITISYTEGDVTKTCELPVTVKDKSLASIAVKTEPTTTEYTEGDAAVDLTGLVLTLTYDDESKSEVSYSSSNKDDFTVSGFDSSAAAESQAITVTYGGKTATFNVVIKEKVYFSAFDAGADTGKTADSSDYEAISSTDGLVVTSARAKFQLNTWSTRDYDADAGTGYTYTARVKVNKASGSTAGTLTIKNVKVGDVLRFDGGNSGSGDRKMTITGADETVWTASASTFGSFYLTATAETIVLTSEDNEFSIYGIHVVSEKVATTVVSEVTTYTKPTLTLSETSVTKDTNVTVTTEIPEAKVATTYSDGKVVSTTQAVTAEITYEGATVTDGKVDTSAAGTLSITASYTIGTGDEAVTYTSDPVTLEVAGEFAVATENVANNEATLGLTATSVTSSATEVATVALSDDKSNIVISSVAAGTATITASDGTNSSLLVVSVTASGAISTTVFPYFTTVKWNVDELFGDEEGKTALGDITEDKEIGGLTLYATSAAKFTSQARSKKIDGISFSNALNFNGTSTLTADAKARVIKITTDKAAKITVYGEGSNSGRKFVLSDAELKEVGAKEFTTTQKEDLGIVSAGTYYISATASLRLSQIVIASVVASDLSAE